MTEQPDVPLAVRAQILATEHWSLLATRSQTWSEVMGRISAQFTFASASLVVLALSLQVVGMNNTFRLLAVWLALAVLVTGSLTALRVRNASQEDMLLVVGMNRLRAAHSAYLSPSGVSTSRQSCRPIRQRQCLAMRHSSLVEDVL